MTRQEKISRMIQWLTTAHMWRAPGNRYGYLIYDGKLFVAEEKGYHGGPTQIASYDLDDLPKWYD